MKKAVIILLAIAVCAFAVTPAQKAAIAKFEKSFGHANILAGADQSVEDRGDGSSVITRTARKTTSAGNILEYDFFFDGDEMMYGGITQTILSADKADTIAVNTIYTRKDGSLQAICTDGKTLFTFNPMKRQFFPNYGCTCFTTFKKERSSAKGCAEKHDFEHYEKKYGIPKSQLFADGDAF